MLEQCGYRYSKVIRVFYEDDEYVVLFTLPKADRRVAFTAFIEDTVDYGIAIEVFKGFVADKKGAMK